MIRRDAARELRMMDLLVERATEGLADSAARELDGLLEVFPEQKAEGFDLAAAAINLAVLGPVREPLSVELRDRLMIDAGMYFAAHHQSVSTVKYEREVRVARRKARGQRKLPWYLAAASIVLALLGWWQVFHPEGSLPSAPRSFAEFLADPDVVRAPWVGSEAHYAAVTGEALWSDANQTGFMRFVGLEPNDPQRFQYQLWIVDPQRDKHPVDGGVFDVPDAGEVIVSMNAKLQVKAPRMFAITREKAGGVVVSEGPLLLVGSVPG